MTRLWKTIGKMIVGGIGLVAMAVTDGLVHGNALAIANAVIIGATMTGIYRAPHATTLPPK